MAGANIGMMDKAFFVGRKAILDWLNTTFSMNVAKIEDTASGAVACQILDAIYPGEVAMGKVRWDAKSSHEFIDNYKLVQRVFDKKGVDKHVDVEKLIRAKYQDNLEMMQWFKSFFERNYGGQPYDALARRAKGRGADAMPAFSTHGAAAGEDDGPAAAPAAAGGGGHAAPAPAAAPAAAAPKAAATSSRQSTGTSGRAAASRPTHASPAGAGAAGAATSRIAELTGQIAELRLSVESMERERDFYFGKLRDIEILLQTYAGPDPATVATIFKILYATEEDFVQVGPDGQPLPPANADTSNTSGGGQAKPAGGDSGGGGGGAGAGVGQ